MPFSIYNTMSRNKEEFKIAMDRALEAYNLKRQNQNLIEDLKDAKAKLFQGYPQVDKADAKNVKKMLNI